MVYVGIDLHKKTIVLCVVDQQRVVLTRKTLSCAEPKKIVAFFRELGEFQAVVEATASYEWLWLLLEPLARRLVLAHPKKLRIIAESRRKSDRIDAQVLAEFLARDEIPESYWPTPRQRQHRVLVRHRCYVRRRAAAAKVKIRRILADYNADRSNLFSIEGQKYLSRVKLAAADRFVIDQLRDERTHRLKQLTAIEQQLARICQACSGSRTGSAGGLGVGAERGHGDGGRGPERSGRCAALSFDQRSGRLCRAGAGLPGIGRQAARPLDQQGGLAAAALGLGGSGLAAGALDAALADGVREFEPASGRAQGDRGDRPPAADDPGGGMAQRPMLSTAHGVTGQRGGLDQARGWT
jgi:transposase